MRNTAEAMTERAMSGPVVSKQLLEGQTVLLVEDNLMVAVATEDLFRAMGAVDVELSSTVDDAIERLRKADVSLAILDVNLMGETSRPVAEACLAADVPFVLATGFGSEDDALRDFPAAPVCVKPYSRDKLQDAILQIQSGRS